MDIRGDKKRAAHSCGLYCPCGKLSTAHLIVKIFLAVAVIGLGLVISMEIIYNISKDRVGRQSRFDMMNAGQSVQGQFVGAKVGSGTIMMGNSNVAYKAGGEMTKMQERIFGVITKIEANKITIKNNAAVEQLVVSQADTVIVSSTTEVGIASLQVGHNIIVIGSIDKDNTLTAKMISIK